MKSEIVVIGAGQAGCMTAVSLRQKKYKGSILIVGNENHFPYQRPPLSKGFLMGTVGQETLKIKSSGYFKRNKINLLRNKNALKIDKVNKIVFLEDGGKIHFKKLVIATGSSVKKINLKSKIENLFYLRNIEDCQQIRSAINKFSNIVIIGAGYIGLEVASVAVRKNVRVDIIEIDDMVMSRSLCKETSRFLQKQHEKEGVNFNLNTSIHAIENHKDSINIILSNGSQKLTKALVIGIGVNPNTKLAEESGLKCENGIIVDENGQTSDKSIFAVGDCTSHPNKIYNRRLRLESVHNALEQAKTVASSINGINKPYQQVPWFWSDQYELKIQIAGIKQSYDQYLLRGNIKSQKFAVFYLNQNRIMAVEAINDQESFSVGKKLILSKKDILPINITNTYYYLKEYLK